MATDAKAAQKTGVSKDVKDSSMPKMPDISAKDLSTNLERLKPVIEALVKFGEVAIPLCEKYYAIAHKFYMEYLDQFYSQDLLELCLGMILLFFGGNFALTIACYTAIKLSGYDTLKSSISSLWDTYLASKDAINKDLKEQLDTDGDGKVSASELAKALGKPEHINLLTLTLLKAVDPNRLLDAVKGLWTVLMSVMVTLRFQFSKQVTIGANVGKVLQENLEIYFEDGLKELLHSYHPTYAKWSNFIIVCFTRVVCITLSMMLTRIVAAYHSALKGGDILSKALMRILTEQKIIEDFDNATKSNIRMGLQQALAAYGFWTQFKSAFALAWWLKIPLFPFIMLESFLTGMSYYAV